MNVQERAIRKKYINKRKEIQKQEVKYESRCVVCEVLASINQKINPYNPKCLGCPVGDKLIDLQQESIALNIGKRREIEQLYK